MTIEQLRLNAKYNFQDIELRIEAFTVVLVNLTLIK